MLSEWVRYYHQPGMFKEGDKIYAAYVARVGDCVCIAQVLSHVCVYIFVTGSAKTGLIAHDIKFNFLSQIQRHINTLSSFTAKMKKSLVVCFCWLFLPSPLSIRTSGLGPSWSSGGKVED